MTSNFDNTFEKNKKAFAQKFGIEWNTNPQLYLAYLQTIYIATLAEINNNGLSRSLATQNEIMQLLQSLSKKL